MENYHSGDYNKWDSTKCLSDQMLLYSLYYTTNQEEILLAKETLQQVSMEMQQVENKAKKDNTISVAKEIGSFGISLIPFLGDGKDLQESISGLDLITGKKLSALERVLAGACVIVPVISGSMVRIAGKNADIAEKMSLLSEKQLFKKAGKGIAMCEDAKKEMEQLIQGIRTMLEEDADIKRLFIRKTGAGPQVEIAGVGKVSLEEAEELIGKDVRWSRGKSRLNSELTPSQIESIVNTPKGSRPDPSSYLSKEYIDAHLAQFDDGVSVIQTEWAYSRYSETNGFVGVPDDNSLFVMPKNYCDDVVASANGNVSIIEKKLGFQEGYFSDGGGLVRIDAPNTPDLNIRIPSGNETGANKLWSPGGKTSGGIPEAITNTIPLKDTIITRIDIN